MFPWERWEGSFCNQFYTDSLRIPKKKLPSVVSANSHLTATRVIPNNTGTRFQTVLKKK